MGVREQPRLLKAGALREQGTPIAFNFDDLKERCEAYIAQIREQAQQLLVEAHTEAEQLKEHAYAQGLQAGKEAGRAQQEVEIRQRVDAQVQQRVQQQLQTALPALQQAAVELQAERDRWLAAWEAAAIRLSVAIAERILRAKLAHDPSLAISNIREALQLAAGNPQIRLHLHPSDVQQLGAESERLLRGLSSSGTAELVSDSHVAPGGCIIQTQHGVIDAQLQTQLDRIASELIDSDSV